jgi:hypothetical protein
MIKNDAITTLVQTSLTNRYEAVIIGVLGCISAKAYNLSDTPKDIVSKLASHFKPDGKETPEDVILAVFDLLTKYNIKIIKDENRQPTWSTPNKSWYLPDTRGPKKPWVF